MIKVIEYYWLINDIKVVCLPSYCNFYKFISSIKLGEGLITMQLFLPFIYGRGQTMDVVIGLFCLISSEFLDVSDLLIYRMRYIRTHIHTMHVCMYTAHTHISTFPCSYNILSMFVIYSHILQFMTISLLLSVDTATFVIHWGVMNVWGYVGFVIVCMCVCVLNL